MTELPQSPIPGLAREVNLREATALNIIDMIGVGPFVTIPLIIHAMHGPQAMLGWVLGALLAMCDGLVWAELGASMPQAGGSYQYLKESYGAKRLVIVAGLTHFNAARAFTFAPGAFNFSSGFITGLGAAMLVATYDYWGYYNVCFLGAEIKRPERNIPRAILISIVVVATLYLLMNISILGVLPWQELDQAAASESRFYVASTLLQRTFGTWWGM